jgi:hypothetical protein
MFQKKPHISGSVPIGGAVGWVFLMAGNANKNAPETATVGGSIFRFLIQIEHAILNTVRERTHIVRIRKTENIFVVAALATEYSTKTLDPYVSILGLILYCWRPLAETSATGTGPFSSIAYISALPMTIN